MYFPVLCSESSVLTANIYEFCHIFLLLPVCSAGCRSCVKEHQGVVSGDWLRLTAVFMEGQGKRIQDVVMKIV
jgi:hypothetical protein